MGNPGDRNWRDFVGPAQRWDSQAALQFVTLITFGMRENHRVCDVGCGSLRAGRLLIPYLEAGCYFGIEPEKWLLEDGIKYHVGDDLLARRNPRFITERTDFPIPAFGVRFHYILAQSILTHTTREQVHEFLGNAADCLMPDGFILATWQKCLEGADADPVGWSYPHCVGYSSTFMEKAGQEYGLKFAERRIEVLDLKACWGVWRR